MKKYVSTMMAGVAALAIASSASAQTITLRITGSTAFRKPTMIAIQNILSPGFVYGYAGTDVTKANIAEFRGTTIAGGTPVDIKCAWSGSNGGAQVVVTGLTVANWLASTNLTSGAGTQNLAGPFDAPTKADCNMADQYQGSTPWTVPVEVDQVVGVIPFQWARNVGCPASFSNMSTLLSHILLGTGQIPFSQATGLNADEATLLTLTGRDEDSGTRVITYAETGFGIYGAPFQYQPQGTLGVAGAITGLIPWPVNTVNGTTFPVGHSGFPSGSFVANSLLTPMNAATLGYLTSYAGISDVATAVAGGATALTWNGVPYSATAVAEGQYTFWSYEHMMYLSSLPSSQKTIANLIATRIKTVDAANGGILISTMQVGRSGDGTDVTFGSPY